jgi:cellulose synthase/poly-beta-1,6-N-acetylglucosamine synthase-like glycosyltransferase
MLTFLSIALAAVACVLLVPTVIFFIEVMAGCFMPMRRLAGPNEAAIGRIAVIIPAHNESVGLRPTLEDVKEQLRPEDRLIVVADNCTDDTAAVAMASGAETVVRFDPTRVGKGYALDYGIRHLADHPPEVVICIDADCRLSKSAIEILSEKCRSSGKPVQALDLMVAASETQFSHRVAEFAWRIKNLLRPLGLSKLDFPCQLMGTGMAFPWEVISSATVSSSCLVEDMKLGSELATQGRAAIFCPAAVVTSTFPTSASSTAAQRQRWEQGHISLILNETPKLIRAAVLNRDLKILAFALDLAIPPLSLLIALLVVSTATSCIGAIFGLSANPLLLNAACLALIGSAISAAWVKHGRDVLPATELRLVFSYFVRKLSLYVALAAGNRALQWARADRNLVSSQPGHEV